MTDSTEGGIGELGSEFWSKLGLTKEQVENAAAFGNAGALGATRAVGIDIGSLTTAACSCTKENPEPTTLRYPPKSGHLCTPHTRMTATRPARCPALRNGQLKIQTPSTIAFSADGQRRFGAQAVIVSYLLQNSAVPTTTRTILTPPPSSLLPAP